MLLVQVTLAYGFMLLQPALLLQHVHSLVPRPHQLPSLGVRKSSTGEDLVSFLTLWAASRRVCEQGKLVANNRLYLWGLKVTCWLKHWTADGKV